VGLFFFSQIIEISPRKTEGREGFLGEKKGGGGIFYLA
jgi:hypothetical protein